MSALLRLERDFQHCVLSDQRDLEGQVVGTAQASAEERVRVYVEAYRLRLLEILEDNYHGLQAVLGTEEFDKLGRAYIDAHPSTHPSVRWFSRHLEKFLRHTPSYAEQAALAEMAAFEWAQGLVFDAADEPAASLQEMAAIPPESWAGLRFELHAAVQRLEMIWNVPAFWQAVDKELQPPQLQTAATPVHWLLWRADLTTHWRSLADDEAWALDTAREGADFAALCEGLCRWHAEPEVALQAASLLKRWLTDGLLKAIVAA